MGSFFLSSCWLSPLALLDPSSSIYLTFPPCPPCCYSVPCQLAVAPRSPPPPPPPARTLFPPRIPRVPVAACRPPRPAPLPPSSLPSTRARAAATALVVRPGAGVLPTTTSAPSSARDSCLLVGALGVWGCSLQSLFWVRAAIERDGLCGGGRDVDFLSLSTQPPFSYPTTHYTLPSHSSPLRHLDCPRTKAQQQWRAARAPWVPAAPPGRAGGYPRAGVPRPHQGHFGCELE